MPRPGTPLDPGDAIEVAETVHLASGGGREWEIRPVSPGPASLSGSNDGRAFDFGFRVR